MIAIHNPNLPTAPVKLVIMSGEYKFLNVSMSKLSISVLNCETNILLDRSICNHSDILIHHLGDNNILMSKEQMFLSKTLLEFGFNINYIKNCIKSPYPNDVRFNAARLGKYLICNPKLLAHEILEIAEYNDLKIIPVNQGYSKCSICAIDEHSIITDDRGISVACELKGLDTLLISKGSVKIKEYSYGFIGGCTGLIDKNKLAFCGNVEKHSDYKEILKFLDEHKIDPVNLYEGDLLDIGGIIPISQEI